MDISSKNNMSKSCDADMSSKNNIANSHYIAMLLKNNIAINLYLVMFSKNDIAITRLWQYYQITTTRNIDIFNCHQKILFPYIVIWTCLQKTST